MADIDDEIARFEAELMQAEQQQRQQHVDQSPVFQEQRTKILGRVRNMVVQRPPVAPISSTSNSAGTNSMDEPTNNASDKMGRSSAAKNPACESSQVPSASVFYGNQTPTQPAPQLQPPSFSASNTVDESSEYSQSKSRKRKPNKDGVARLAAGKLYYDNTLNEWPANDYRLFVGDLGTDVADSTLTNLFKHYPSFAKAKVVRNHKLERTKGYGFVSFLDPNDAMRALREMDGKFCVNRPMKLKKSDWTKHNLVHTSKKSADATIAENCGSTKPAPISSHSLIPVQPSGKLPNTPHQFVHVSKKRKVTKRHIF